jgi:hypothetical protein
MKSKSLLFPLFENFQNLGACNSGSFILSEFLYFFALRLLEIEKIAGLRIIKNLAILSKKYQNKFNVDYRNKSQIFPIFLEKRDKICQKKWLVRTGSSILRTISQGHTYFSYQYPLVPCSRK